MEWRNFRIVAKLILIIAIFISLSPFSYAQGEQLGAPNPNWTIQKQGTLSSIGKYEGKKILFIEDDNLINNKTDWDGLSSLREMLESMGFEVTDVFPDQITLSLLDNYDIVVFSTSWSQGWVGQREITDDEAQALVDFVNAGGGLFLIGEHGLNDYWSPAWTNSVNKVGNTFGIDFQMDMLCDPTNHRYSQDDPDGGVDWPLITDIRFHSVTSGVNTFMLNWGSSLRVSPPAQVIAYSDEDSWCDRNGTWDGNNWVCQQDSDEPSGSYPVLAVVNTNSGGRIVAIGDPSWMVNSWIDDYDHRQLAENIFSWLAKATNQLPVIDFFTASPQNVNVGDTVTFTCQAHDPNPGGSIVSYKWDFGDGTSDETTTDTISHAYIAAGTPNVICTVVDDRGGESASWSYVSVSPAPADNITRLVEYDPNTPKDKRIPLILIHGLDGTEDLQGNGIIEDQDIIKSRQSYWKDFLEYFNRHPRHPDLSNYYKIYEYYYLSNIKSVWNIARSLRNHIDVELHKGKIADVPFVILAHSMGGLVARSYMEEHWENVGKYKGKRAGERVLKLITLATPHHGTPLANDDRFDPLVNPGWSLCLAPYDSIFWEYKESCHACISDPTHPNRAALRWDNYYSDIFTDRNDWLRNLNSKSLYDNKIIAYCGEIGEDAEVDLYGSMGPAKFNGYLASNLDLLGRDKHTDLRCIGVLLQRIFQPTGEKISCLYNDGVVSTDSASFSDHHIYKRVTCKGHDHLDMENGGAGKCSTGLGLFASVDADLYSIATAGYPSTPLPAMPLDTAINPAANTIAVPPGKVSICPSLTVPAGDRGQQAQLFMYIHLYLPSYDTGIPLFKSHTITLGNIISFDGFFSGPIDFSDYSGLVAYIYYGYSLSNGDIIKYNAYELKISQ